MRRAKHRFWNSHLAATHLVFFIISAAIFIPVVIGLFLYTQDLADTQNDNTAGLSSRASAALVQMTSNPGLNAAGTSTKWEDDPVIAGVKQVGLRDEDSMALGYDKIDHLQRAGVPANAADGYLNYEEMQTSLNLGKNFDFHIRLFPVLEKGVADPYATAGIKGTRVAYVANMTGHAIDTTPGASFGTFTQPTAAATKEIAALGLLDLGSTVQSTYYQPANVDATLYALPPPGYTNPAAIDGDVVADTSRLYKPSVLAATAAYHRHFIWDQFQAANGDYNYDAIVFGSNVDLSRWAAYAQNLTGFVNAGGIVIFLGNTNVPADFVTDCTTAQCLFYQTGSGQPITTPDPTNQILSIPNKLKPFTAQAGTKWSVCDDERKGFLPVIANVNDPCLETDLGITSSDRYGPQGGTVIIGRWDFAAMGNADVAKALSNFLNYGFLRPLYLDYGREIPADEPVSTATRLMTTEMPNGSSRDVKIVLYLWRRG